MAFSLVAEKKEDVNILILKGYVDIDAGKEIGSKIKALRDQGEKFFVFDFSDAPIINSAAHAVLVDLCAEVASNLALKFGFFGLSSPAQVSFKYIGILDYIPSYSSKKEAIKAVKST